MNLSRLANGHAHYAAMRIGPKTEVEYWMYFREQLELYWETQRLAQGVADERCAEKPDHHSYDKDGIPLPF